MNEKELIIQQHEENAWLIINSDSGEIENIITKDEVVEYCKRQCETINTDYVSADEMIEAIWYNLTNAYGLEDVDCYCDEFDKFTTWFEYVCVEYFANELIASYKQRLLDFE